MMHVRVGAERVTCECPVPLPGSCQRPPISESEQSRKITIPESGQSLEATVSGSEQSLRTTVSESEQSLQTWISESEPSSQVGRPAEACYNFRTQIDFNESPRCIDRSTVGAARYSEHLMGTSSESRHGA